jgi:hypothetical protein
VQDPYVNSVLEAIASAELDAGRPHLITVDELRAAGALDVPAAWRKSLGREERDLFSDLTDDDSGLNEVQPTSRDADGSVSTAETP